MAASESSVKLLAESGLGSTSNRSARNPPTGAPTPDRSGDSSSSPTITASSSAHDLKGIASGTVAGSASGGRGEAYVNQGLANFERKRALWLGGGAGGLVGGSGGTGAAAAGKSSGEVRARIVDVEDVVDKIFSQTGSGQLSHPLPLGQMIDILVEFWEADGLYD
jgi:hypothetical protein